MSEKKSMLEEEIEVYSEKNDVRGVIRDYGVVTKLFFTYAGREIEMGIKRNLLSGETYEKLGQQLIDSYISNNPETREITLHNWYLERRENNGEEVCIGHGVVTGHPSIPDSVSMHTSRVQAVYSDFDNGEVVVTTLNNVYHCPMEYCRWKKQDEYSELISDYAKMKELYQGKIVYPSIESGKVLLVLSNFSEFYFHSLCYVPVNVEDGKRAEYSGYPHIGTFQDSYLIQTDDYSIDLRYFPHYQNVEFYSEDTDGNPLFLENIGDVVLYAKTSAGLIKLAPGERKEVVKANAEKERPVLPSGDLYPAGIME